MLINHTSNESLFIQFKKITHVTGFVVHGHIYVLEPYIHILTVSKPLLEQNSAHCSRCESLCVCVCVHYSLLLCVH